MSRQLLFLFLLGLWTLAVRAENSDLVTSVNELKYMRSCLSVSDNDLAAAGFCAYRPKPWENQKTLWQVFNWNIFQVAAENQLNKNQCMIEEMAAFAKHPELQDDWAVYLAKAWMGAKKADLILRHCVQEWSQRGIQREAIDHKGMKEAFEDAAAADPYRVPKPLEAPWDKLCTDTETLASLRAAKVYFQLTLPMMTGRDYFKIMEKHRDDLINPKTGSPISDADILKTDLSTDGYFEMNLSAGFAGDLNAKLKDLKDERKEMTAKLKASKKDGNYDLSEDQKKYIYDDGTLYDTLVDKHLMSQASPGLTHKKELSNGAFCVLAKYEPSTTGNMAEFLALTVSGGEIFDAFRGFKALQGIEESAAAESAVSQGRNLTSYAQLGLQWKHACGAEETDKKMIGMSNLEGLAVKSTQYSPHELGYKKKDLAFDPKETPSCKASIDHNFIANPGSKTWCIVKGVMLLAPIRLSIPVTAGVILSQ